MNFPETCPEALATQHEGTSIANDWNDSLQYAKTLNCKVVIPGEREVFIDIDSGAAFDLYRMKLAWYQTQAAIKERKITPSKSGWPHCHIILEVQHDLSDFERIAIQSILGSCNDTVLCSLRNAQCKDLHPVRFFEKEIK